MIEQQKPVHSYAEGAEIHDECGVFGLFGVENAANLCYYGLHALQHRGQESCGIVCVDENREFRRAKGEGLVAEVFTDKILSGLHGCNAIAHVRYSGGDKGLESVQPFYFRHNTGNFALAINGSFVNARELTRYLENKNCLFQSTSDCELLAHLVKKDRGGVKHRIQNIVDALNMIEGAFAFVILSEKRLYCARDKYGLHPLSIGRLNDGYVVSSETCGLDAVGAEYIRDVEPGEIVIIDDEGMHSVDYSHFKHHYMCSMEYIYFARPDSDIEGQNVHAYRKESGRILYREQPVEADIVIGVPDSSLSAAVGYSEESGIPYEMGLIKNKYVGRTFIQPSQDLREKGVRMKLSAVRSIVKGKRVVVIDDSIVRGTTSRRIINLIREAGAKEVHMRIASPPYAHPCFYGVDTATYDELVASHMSIDEIKEMIGADSLGFLSVEGLYKSGRRNELCVACFSGHYPTSLYGALDEAVKK